MPASSSETIGSGGSYATFAAWWADLPAGPWGSDFEAELLSDTASDDMLLNTTVDMNGFKARVFTQEGNRGNGGPDLPTITGSISNAIIRHSSGTVHLELDGIGVENTHATGRIGALFSATLTLDIRDCYLVGSSSGSTQPSLNIDDSGTSGLIENTTIEVSSARGADLRGSGGFDIKNCLLRTTDDTGTHGWLLDSGSTIYSTAAFGFTSADFFEQGTVTGDYNIADDTTATEIGANSTNSVTLTDTDQSGDIYLVESVSGSDYRLKSASTGTNVPVDNGDPSNSTASDQIGTTRSTPDAGPFELVAAGGVTLAERGTGRGVMRGVGRGM